MLCCLVWAGSEYILTHLLVLCVLPRFKVFQLPEQQVQILHLVEKLRAGDVVYAVYPDTTSFYQVSLQSPVHVML